MRDNINFVAKYLKKLEKPKEFQTCVGVVIKAPPELTISILFGKDDFIPTHVIYE